MTLELWMAFVIAYTIISIIPGPSVLLVVNQALTGGVRAAFMCIMGELLGGVVLIGLALFGVGSVLAASPQLFQIVKWAGVAYMAYLGISQIMNAKTHASIDRSHRASVDVVASFKAGLFTAILNPKAIAFYVAFLSQFLTPDAGLATQFTIVVASSTVVVFVALGAYALLAVQAKRIFRNRQTHKKFGYVGGGCLLGGSMWIALTR